MITAIVSHTIPQIHYNICLLGIRFLNIGIQQPPLNHPFRSDEKDKLQSFEINSVNPYDNKQIKSGLNEIYQQINSMPRQEMDRIIHPVCKLCRDHEKAGFIEGIQLGITLAQEIAT